MASVLAAVEGDEDWLFEIDLDPHGAWLRMGTRNLGARPWLVADGRRDAELSLKRSLLAERFDEVFAAEEGSESAGAETLALVSGALAELSVPVQSPPDDGDPARPDMHPLEVAGRLVQEDLCLLRPRGDGAWVLAAASLCFPSRWRLRDKLGRGLTTVHQPVSGYQPTLNTRVDSLMTRLAGRDVNGDIGGSGSDSGRVVWRRNWFIHPDGTLFQPDRPAVDPVITAESCLDGLFLRSERQTVRALPGSGWVLFTIRTQQTTLARMVSHPELRSALSRYLADGNDDLVGHRGVGPEQRRQLSAALERWPQP